MKVAVIKLGARISFNANDTSGGNGEARSIIKILEGAGAEVHIYTKILKKDTLISSYKWHNIEDDYKSVDADADALVVINGNVNFFGGAEDRSQILNYHIINYFAGPVFYAYCDPALTLKQLWPAVSKKPWGTNYNRQDIEIVRNDIVYLSQPYDVDKLTFNTANIVPGKVIHFPFEQFPCLNHRIGMNQTPEVDLSYGGTMRGGKRTKKMVKFYFGHPEDISVEMFGKIDAKDFDEKLIGNLRPPVFTGPVRYEDMLPKMNKALAHCVIGDPFYEKINDMAQRAYESIWSNVVTFIDSDLDEKRRVYGSNSELSEFLYVDSREALSERIQILKEEPALRRQILQEQFSTINFDADTYCNRMLELITKS